jgi:NodT family efflux transporter outer membrane factor (OMF) lipoprotein
MSCRLNPSRLFAAALPLLLSACAAVGPDYRTPEIPVPAAWRGGAPADAAAPALGRWWQSLDDVQAVALVDAALEHSPDLLSAQANLRAARAQWRAAGADLGPTLEGATGASRSRGSRETGSSGDANTFYQAGFDARWELDLFGATRRGIEAARADLAASEYTLADAQASLVAEVLTNLTQYRATAQRLEIARRNLAAQGETLQITDWRVQAGLVGALDLEQARANQAQTEAQVPALETQLEAYANALAVLVGLPPGQLQGPLATGADLPPVPARVDTGIPADLLRRRPDLRAAERQLAAATARIGAAEAARYPSVVLTGSLGLEALSFGALGGAEALTRSLAGSIGATLFDGGRLRAQVDLQQANRDAAYEAYRQAVLVALQDVEDALVEVANGRRREGSLATAAEAARNAALLARHQYEAGIVDFRTVLDTERTRLAAEDSHASARAELVTARIRLIKAVGGGLPAEAGDPRQLQMGMIR